MSSLRQVQQGQPYQLPPSVNGIPPSSDELLMTWQQNITKAAALAAAERAAAASKRQHSNSASSSSTNSHGSISAGATRAYMGVSPSLVEELCQIASINPQSSPDSLTSQDWCELHSAWLIWLDRLHSGNFTACSCPSTKKFSVLGTYNQPHGSVHDMVDGYYRTIQAGEVYSNLHQRLSNAMKQALKKARGKVYSFQQQLTAADNLAALQKEADIIVANLYRCVFC